MLWRAWVRRVLTVAIGVPLATASYLAARPKIADAAFLLAGPHSPTETVSFFMRQYGIESAVIAYTQRDGPAKVTSIGKLTPGSIIPIASLSKPITASAILKLIDAGKLSLDTRLASIFPELQSAPDRRYLDITVDQMLHHTGGWGELYSLDGQDDCSGFAHAKAQFMLAYEPGSTWDYTNIGYCWLGLIVTKVSGKPYDEYAKGTVLAGMGSFELPVKSLGGAYGWTANASDVLSFVSSVTDPGAAVPATWSNSDYGFGWFVEPEAFWHIGAIRQTTGLALHMTGQSIVVLFDKRPPNHRQALIRLKNLLVSENTGRL